MEKVNILGIPFNALTTAETLTLLESWLTTEQNHIIVTPNPEGVMQAKRNPNFFNALQNADLRLADGIGIVLAAKLKGKPIHERVRGVDTIYSLFDALNKKSRTFTAYFLGGKPGIAEIAKVNMETKFKNLKIVGCHHGFFKENSAEEESIIESINKLKPDILLICTGMPRAEIWAQKHRNINARLTLCLGGTIDIMSGTVKLAPPVLRKLGLEWMYRLYKQPSRFVRMLDIPRFVMAALMEDSNAKIKNN